MVLVCAPGRGPKVLCIITVNMFRKLIDEETRMMRFALAGVVVTAGVLAGCAASPEMIECLQPDRRGVLEINGTRVKPAPKPKPDAKPEAKPEAAATAGKPEAKPAAAPKPALVAVELSVNIQGNTAFDPKLAVLKPDGKKEIDKFIAAELKGKQPVTIGSIIITGHSDNVESSGENTTLSEARAKSVMEYLISKGFDQKLMFWEGRGSRQPVPVTKFCS